MKRVISFLLVAFMLTAIIPVSGKAVRKTEETIYYADGSYMTIAVIYAPVRATWGGLLEVSNIHITKATALLNGKWY